MADDQGKTPTPRPRRRRTDIDPKAPSPPVANERRRRKPPAATDPSRAATPPTPTEDAPVDAAPTDSASGGGRDPSAPFHVPGVAPAAVATPVAVADGPPPATDPGRAWLARLDDRSADPNVCPFLRAAADGRLVAPIESPDPANRCAALSEAVPQSLRQQELVCLSSGHINCPRYLRGAAVAIETPTPVVRAGRTLTTPVFASLIVLVMAVSASVAFALTRGGLVLEGAGPSPSHVAVLPSPSSLAVEPTALVTPVPPLLAASVEPTTLVDTDPDGRDPPRPRHRRASPPRHRPPTDTSPAPGLPNTPKCWIYTVRRGDNVFSIANYFGVSQDSIYARNPWLKQSGLRSGQQLRLPPPTR